MAQQSQRGPDSPFWSEMRAQVAQDDQDRREAGLPPLQSSSQAGSDDGFVDFGNGLRAKLVPESASSQSSALVAEALGTPVDLVNWALGKVGAGVEDPFLGSESIKGGFRSAGIPTAFRPPETGRGHAVRGITGAALTLLPFLGALGRGAAATGVTQKFMRGVRGKGPATGPQVNQVIPKGPTKPGLMPELKKTVLEPFERAPYRSALSELTAGTAAGVVQPWAERAVPDSPLGQAGITLGAAVGAGSLPMALTKVLPTYWAYKIFRSSIDPFTARGARKRVQERVMELAGGPEEAQKIVTKLKTDDTLAEEAYQSVLQRTRNPELIALEKAILETDKVLKQEFAKNSREGTDEIKRMLDAVRNPPPIAGEVPLPSSAQVAQALQEAAENRVNYLVALLKQRLSQAEDMAAQRLASLTPQKRLGEASIVVREELDEALTAVRKTEKELWRAIDEELIAIPRQGRAAYEKIVKDTPAALRDDLPLKAKQFLQPDVDEAGNAVPGAFKSAGEPIKEIHGLYSSLRQTAREARSTGNFNKARMADEIAEGLWNDIAPAEVSGEVLTDATRLLRDARKYSRTLNETFRQGQVGRILGYSREGGTALAPELTLSTAIGAGGTAGAVGVRDIRKAFEVAAREGIKVEDAIEQFIRRLFVDKVDPQGQGIVTNLNQAKQFLVRNSELLMQFPKLRRQFQELVRRVSSDIKGQQIDDVITAGLAKPGLKGAYSQTALLAEESMDQIITKIMRSKDAGKAARELTQLLGEGWAPQGRSPLKDSFLEYLMKEARLEGQLTEAGEPILSGNKLFTQLREPQIKKAAAVLLTPDEQSRLNSIVELMRTQDIATGGSRVGDLLTDKAGQVAEMMGSFGGARLGAYVAGGRGAVLKIVSMFSSGARNIIARMTENQAQKLLRDMVQDENTFIALMTPLETATPAQIQFIEKTVMRLLGYTGAELARLPETLSAGAPSIPEPVAANETP